MKNNPLIEAQAAKFKKEYISVLKAIKRYDRIVVFRHICPDYDALGTQLGLAQWIKDNFKDKEVRVVGDNHVNFTPRLFPEMDKLNDEWFKKPFLGIVVDVNAIKRIADPRFKKAKFKITIDHHPLDTVCKSNTVIDDTSMAAASEIVTNMLMTFEKKGYVLSQEAAKWLYIALVGDSGRFQYSSTTAHTFAVAEKLISTGLEISKIYNAMYLKTIHDLQITSYILNHFTVSEHGVAYYVLTKEIQEQLEITTERGKENVNVFANIQGINAWCSITEDLKEPCFRISIRSRGTDISGVARAFEGGGHAQASGAKIKDLTVLPEFIKALDDLFI